MADLFSTYEQDLREVIASLDNHIRSISRVGSPEAKHEEVKKAEGDLRDAEDILQSMNLNARNVHGSQ